jgi:hypothetical protein
MARERQKTSSTRLEHLQLLQDAVAHRAAENLALGIDWSRLASSEAPSEWLEGDEPKPF